MPILAASIHRASYHVLLLLLLTAAVADVSTTSGGDGSTAAGNATATKTTGGDGPTEMYICYLCTGRNPMLIRRCPIYWDFCHLVCYAPAATAGAAFPIAAAAPPRRVGGVPQDVVNDEECYVMKLYENGSYVIVVTLGCSQIATCLLSCGGGDLAATDGEVAALGAAVSQPVTATALHGVRPMSPPRVGDPDFQRCGAQAMTAAAPRAITGGV